MKVAIIVLLSSIFFISANVNAIDEENKYDYQQDILNIINGYGEKFDDCFTTLPADFPDVSTEYLELNEKIGQILQKQWYHRVMDTPFYGNMIHEVFYYETFGDTRYVISIQYFFNNITEEFTIPSLYVLSDDYGGETGDFGHIIEGGIPVDVANHSIADIKHCMGTPGFLFVSLLIAMIMIILYSRYKK